MIRKVIVLFIALGLLVSTAYAGFNLGMQGAVKKRVEELDKKVKEKKVEEEKKVSPSAVKIGNSIGGNFPPPIALAYIAPINSSDWGSSYLGVNNYIPAWESKVIASNLTPGVYKIKVCFVHYGELMNGRIEVVKTVSKQPVTLESGKTYYWNVQY
jgi:hypothetical protein